MPRLWTPYGAQAENLEHKVLLDWINDMLERRYKSLLELRNGSAWCLLMHRIHPGSIHLQLINHKDENSSSWIKNYQLLRASLKMLQLELDFNQQELMEGKKRQIVHMVHFFMDLYRKKQRKVIRERLRREAFDRDQDLKRRFAAVIRGEIKPLPRDQLPAQMTFENCHLFFELLSREEGEREMRRQRKEERELKQKQQEQKEQQSLRLAKQAIKAVHWSPTSRRSYVLPKQAARVRQSLGIRLPGGEERVRIRKQQQRQEALLKEKEKESDDLSRVHGKIYRKLKNLQHLMERLWEESRRRRKERRRQQQL